MVLSALRFEQWLALCWNENYKPAAFLSWKFSARERKSCTMLFGYRHHDDCLKTILVNHSYVSSLC